MYSIAVDFDGTLCEDNFPNIGQPKQDMIDLVKRAQKAGAKLVLWTCRRNDSNGEHLNRAVDWCKNQGLTFDSVNENLPEVQKKWGGDTRKVMVDYYLDDKNIGYGSMEFLTNLVQKIESNKQ